MGFGDGGGGFADQGHRYGVFGVAPEPMVNSGRGMREGPWMVGVVLEGLLPGLRLWLCFGSGVLKVGDSISIPPESGVSAGLGGGLGSGGYVWLDFARRDWLHW